MGKSTIIWSPLLGWCWKKKWHEPRKPCLMVRSCFFWAGGVVYLQVPDEIPSSLVCGFFCHQSDQWWTCQQQASHEDSQGIVIFANLGILGENLQGETGQETILQGGPKSPVKSGVTWGAGSLNHQPVQPGWVTHNLVGWLVQMIWLNRFGKAWPLLTGANFC